MKRTWWKEAVAYQIYPRSFMDANGDGVGDLKGITQKLDYLKELGIDVIWICPMYQSPNDDNGYDISDYQAIMDEFGTMEDFDELLAEIHKRGMKLILDLVINHSSDEHEWFIESRSSKENPKRDWYIWQDGKLDENNQLQPPNNWESIFSGSAWKYDEQTGQYYMHIFSEKQPDLNWENPEVRSELHKTVNWWLDKGIDGFRVDAISHIKKKEGLPDMPNPEGKETVSCFPYMCNVPGIDPFLAEFRDKTLKHYDVMTVGEANGVGLADAEKWVGEENGYFNMIFQFEHLGLWDRGTGGGLDLTALKNALTKWQKGLNGRGWNALFLENHDQARSVSTWGNDQECRVQSAKSLAAMFFLMHGTPFIYQGQEIGMTNVKFNTIEEYDDVASKNMYREMKKEGKSHEEIMEIVWSKGRDNSRTPMQWNQEKNGGFSSADQTWIPVNPNYESINVQSQIHDPDSIFSFYQSLIRLRKESEALVYGEYEVFDYPHPDVYAYTRTLGEERFLVISNLYNKNTLLSVAAFSACKIVPVLQNYPAFQIDNQVISLKPYECLVVKLEK